MTAKELEVDYAGEGGSQRFISEEAILEAIEKVCGRYVGPKADVKLVYRQATAEHFKEALKKELKLEDKKKYKSYEELGLKK
ncbi:MAG: hypothetical protein GY861_17640 [bacterium]|nr:hypothetical protein [bacterium]